MNTLLARKRLLLFLALLLIVMKVPVSLAQTEFPTNHGEEKALYDPTIILKKKLNYTIQKKHLTQNEYKKMIRTFSSISPVSYALPTEEQYIGALRRLFQKYSIYSS
ncbi:hypothetical protein J2S09_001640 [Bacillus fengqiuensis]|nr:hypothetical protein [Bacillus fengqiuensis]